MKKSRLERLFDLPFQMTKVATILFIGAMAAVLIVAVFYRYGLNNSIRWSEEVARSLMVWMTFTAIPLAWRKSNEGMDEFVRVDLAIRHLPRRIAAVVEGLSLLVILLFLVVLGWKGLELAQRSSGQFMATIKLSFFWIYLSIPVGCVLMSLATLERMTLLLRRTDSDTTIPTKGVN